MLWQPRNEDEKFRFAGKLGSNGIHSKWDVQETEYNVIILWPATTEEVEDDDDEGAEE